MHTPDLRDPAGFTLVELLAAAFVLVVGAMATFAMIDGANASISANSARVGGTSVARELIEYSRGTTYQRLTPSELETALRERPGIKGGTSNPWKINRRGVDYAVASQVCTFDDPKDGLSATPPDNACPAATAIAGAPANDVNPDDFRRVTFTLTWKAHGRPGTAQQSALIVNPAGGLGPRITVFEDPVGQIDVADTVEWGPSAGQQLESTTAAGVHWTVDDGKSQGDAGGGPAVWNFEWDLGTELMNPLQADGSWVLDGTYTLQAQAKDERGVPGEAKTVVVHVNRHAPDQVGGLDGGFNERFGGVVDMRWNRYPERDVVGYRVSRQSDGQVICYGDESHCTDLDPPSAAAETYLVQAVDCLDLAQASCTPRYGTETLLPVTLGAGSAPPAPTGVTPSVVDGYPRLDWDPAPAGANILFYRIYRDNGTDEHADRYDATITNSPFYTDPEPGTLTTSHAYWVTAVDTNFNESAPSLPVLTQPVL